MKRSLAFIDCETTSLSPFTQAWEFAGIRRDPDGHREEFHFFIGGLDLTHADPRALEIGGFYERHPDAQSWNPNRPGDLDAEVAKPRPRRKQMAYSPMLAAQQVAQICQGAVLVGSNPGFDAERLGLLLRRHNLAPTWHYRPIDVHTLMVGKLIGAGRGPGPVPWHEWPSDHLARELGVEAAGQKRYTAMGDAAWCERIWDTVHTPAGGDQS